MPDPRSPEILAFTTLHAMSIAFPDLQRSPEWKARTGKVRDELRPTPRELGGILRDAARHAERLKAELAG
jgi:hypothetical protein